MKLSRPQLDRLRCAKNRQLYTVDVNGGNERRTYATLFKLGLLDWDPICKGRVVVTAAGEQKLAEARDQRLAQKVPKGIGILRIRNVGDRTVITLTGEHKA